MKIIRGALYAVGCVILLALIAAAILPKEYAIDADITITKNPQEVFEYVKLLKNQENFNFRMMQDPNLDLAYNGVDGTVGAKVAWDSTHKNVGAGEQEIMVVDENGTQANRPLKSIHTEIRFSRPMKSVATASTFVEFVSDTETKITSAFQGTMPYPLNLLTFCIKGKLEKDMNTTLNTLKAVVE